MNENPVRVLDPKTFELIGEVDDYSSLLHVRRWTKSGEFELKISANKRNAAKLQKGRMIVHNDGAGLIRYIERTNGQSAGDEQLLVRGPTLQRILSQRVTRPPIGEAYDGVRLSGEGAIKRFVTAAFVAPYDAGLTRLIVPNFAVETNHGRGLVQWWQTRYAQLDEEAVRICEAAGLGWSVEADLSNKVIKFDVSAGVDRSISQAVRSPVIFAVEFDSVKNQKLAISLLNYKNAAIIAGQGEGEAREIQEVSPIASGLDVFEDFVDARDIEHVDGPSSDPNSSAAKLIERGAQELSKLGEIVSFEGSALNTGPFQYGRDYDLGDIVTQRNVEWNVTVDARIVEVKINYGAGVAGFRSVEPVVGQATPTFINRVRQDFAKLGLLTRQ